MKALMMEKKELKRDIHLCIIKTKVIEKLLGIKAHR